MTTAIRRVSGPATTPVTLAEVKAHCRVDAADDDDYLTALIGVAVSFLDAEGELGRAMITQTWAQYETQSPGWPRLKVGPFQALVSVEYYDASGTLQTATLGDFDTRLDGDFVLIRPKDNREWPAADSRADAIKITYTAGYGDAGADVPDGIRHAILMLVAHWYENRVAVAPASMMPVPFAVAALLNNERVGWYG